MFSLTISVPFMFAAAVFLNICGVQSTGEALWDSLFVAMLCS